MDLLIAPLFEIQVQKLLIDALNLKTKQHSAKRMVPTASYVGY